MDHAQLEELIALFLKVNTKPSDQQFHQLAAAVGIDHEELEAISYRMLSEAETNEPVTAYRKLHERINAAEVDAEEDLSDAQDVLDGEYDPNTTQTNDLMLNDGLPASSDSTQLLQNDTLNDGVSSGDVGSGIAEQSTLYSDGLAPIKLGASARLAASLTK